MQARKVVDPASECETRHEAEPKRGDP
jgi:hypothetical protein